MVTGVMDLVGLSAGLETVAEVGQACGAGVEVAGVLVGFTGKVDFFDGRVTFEVTVLWIGTIGFIKGKLVAMPVDVNGLSTGGIGFGMGLVKDFMEGSEATCRSTGIGGCIVVKLGVMPLSSDCQISIWGGFRTGWFKF
jgi:hypothetical protein